jgi:hypothetical protein
MILKIIGFGIKGYLSDKFNIFDGIISIIGLYEIIFAMIQGLDFSSPVSALRALRLFRTLRVFRMTRIIRSLKYMKVIIEVLIKSIDQFFYIAVILLLFLFIFALLGMEIFSSKEFEQSRVNFSTFLNAFLSVFQIMTMENWQDILHLSFRSDVNNVMACLYLVVWIFIGNYIFLNLFLAILLDGFTDPNAYVVIKEANTEEEELDLFQESYEEKRKAREEKFKKQESKRHKFEWVSEKARIESKKKKHRSIKDVIEIVLTWKRFKKGIKNMKGELVKFTP